MPPDWKERASPGVIIWAGYYQENFVFLILIKEYYSLIVVTLSDVMDAIQIFNLF